MEEDSTERERERDSLTSPLPQGNVLSPIFFLVRSASSVCQIIRKTMKTLLVGFLITYQVIEVVGYGLHMHIPSHRGKLGLRTTSATATIPRPLIHHELINRFSSTSRRSAVILYANNAEKNSNSNLDEDDQDATNSLSSSSEEKMAQNSVEDETTSSAAVNTKKSNDDMIKASASKRQMLGFAIPALGIYLSNPLLSNIDNAFVGQTVGTQGLAALSPATICTDQMLYLFSFLSRATTGLVSRAYGRVQEGEDVDGTGNKTNQQQGNTVAAKDAASAPFTVALICGVALSLFYAVATPKLLSILNVNPVLRPSAASYIYWRGAIAWAALCQSVSLSVMMATRDAITPLKIIGISALVNVIGDYLLCVWPLRWGCPGAAAATAFATLVSSGCMLGALRKKNILPSVRIPTKKELRSLLEFTGPLLAITVTRLIGFVNMQRTAMKFGVQHTAAYQLSINVVLFFLLFGEPLSQLSQTQLPALIDAQNDGSIDKDGDGHDTAPLVRATLKSVLSLGAWTAIGIGSVAGLSLRFGSSLFSSDATVQALAKQASPAVFLTVAIAIFAGTS